MVFVKVGLYIYLRSVNTNFWFKVQSYAKEASVFILLTTLYINVVFTFSDFLWLLTMSCGGHQVAVVTKGKMLSAAFMSYMEFTFNFEATNFKTWHPPHVF